MASIELKGVSKVYANGVTAVSAVDLAIRDGEFVVFLGPSGCGKSTTLRMIAGLETISAGDLLVDGVRVNDVDPADRDLAIVFQNYALYPHMTVRDNLAFGLKLRRLPAAEIDRRIATVGATLGVDKLLARRPGQLSGGQRQRVALGRALVREPKAFLLDEPLSNLDAKLRAAMRTELIKLHRRLGTTMIHVTHDQVEAMTMAERICIMRDGEMIQVGRPLDVYREPADTFVAGFLATPPMNLLDARLAGDAANPRVEAGALAFDVPEALRSRALPFHGRAVILGIRPEDLHLASAAAGPQPAALDGRVETVEALGPETILTVSLPGQSAEIAARVGLAAVPAAGSPVRLHLDPGQITLFDPQTTKRI